MERHRDHDLELRKLTELIGDIRFGVLTTIAEDGSLWSRPISTQQAKPDCQLWFFPKLDSPMANGPAHNRRVSLCYAEPVNNSYVSMWVRASCSPTGKGRELWDPSYQKWLPGGPATHLFYQSHGRAADVGLAVRDLASRGGIHGVGLR